MAQTVPDTTPVNIPDANLRAALETYLGKADGATITRAEMAAHTGYLWGSPLRRTQSFDHRPWNSERIHTPIPSISTPTVPATVIRDLTGLEYLTAIQGLRMIRNRITDLRPLAGLTEMRRLWLQDNLISDLSPLRGLPLDQLSITLNPVSDLSPLAGMVQLANFNCDKCQISDISPLAGLTRLIYLDLQNNYISDISPLTRAHSLSEVFLSDNRISDLSPLAGRNLRSLTAAGNRITDLSPLRNSLAMETLHLNGNQGLRDISLLERMVALKVLRLDGTDVRDLSPLVANTGLGSGDQVNLRNLPNLNADAEQHVATLRGRGVSVFTSNPLRLDKTVRNVRVTPGVERLTVTWNPVTPTAGYTPGYQRVYWWSGHQDRSSGFTPPQHHDVTADASSYTIPNLTPGVVYKVQIYPLSPTGDLSAIASGIPLAPDQYPFFYPDTFPAQRYRADDEIEPVTLPAASGGDGRLRYALAPEPALPTGLSFDAATRTLSGTPADLQDETTYTLTATDVDGDTATLTFSITVGPDLWPIFDRPPADAAFGGQDCMGRDYIENVPAPQWVLPRAVGGNGTLAYALAPALPPGLSYTAPDDPTADGGIIAGTPTEARPETTYTLTATDEDGDETDPPLCFLVQVAADTVPTFDGVTMGALDLSMGAMRATPLPAARGGNPELEYTLAPDLPAGLSFDAYRRMIGGMPAETVPEAMYALTATDVDGDVTDPPLRFPLTVFSTPLQVTLEDAAATEGDPVRFAVKLSRASVEPLTLTWTTGTAGSATPDEDYRAEAAGALTVPVGETEATLVVPTLDDRQVEPAETFTVSAALPASSPGSLTRPEATGTITDDDAAAARKRSLGMVLAGVGRTLAADTVDVIGARFERPPPEATAVLGGEELTLRNAAHTGRWRHAAGAAYGVARALGLEVGMPWAGGIGALGAADGAAWSTLTRTVSAATWDAPHAPDGETGSGPDDAGRHASSAAFREAWGGSAHVPGLAGYDGLAQLGFDRAHAASPRMRTDAWRWRRPVGFRRVSAAEMLTRSRFDAPLGGRDAAAGASDWTLWGRGTASGFNGQPKDGFSMDGNVYSGYLGLDYRMRPDVLLGLAVAHSRGDVDYASAGVTEGALDVELTSVLPYAHWTPRPGLGVWGLLGAGWGGAELRDEAGTVKPGLEMLMAAGGVRQELLKWREIDLALKADTFLTELEAGRGDGLPKTAGDAQRVRLLLESRTAWHVSDESHVTPVLELGGRWDGGKAETGLGAELGGRLEYAHTRLGVGLEAGGRYLLAHQRSAFDEWGASLTLRLDPGVARRGLWLTFAPVWGAESSKVAQMWNGAEVLRTGAAPDDAPGLSPAQLELDLGYGWVTHEGAGLLTTYGGVGMAGPDTRDYRLGVTSAVGDCVDLSMEGARGTRFGGATAHEILLSGSVCW